jgi:hypothetical protein
VIVAPAGSVVGSIHGGPADASTGLALAGVGSAFIVQGVVQGVGDTVIRSREQAQAWLKMAGYQPTETRIGPLTRLGGRIVKANVAFDDHPSALRFSGRINAVTVDSIVAFVRQRDEGWSFTEIKRRKPSAP